MLALSAWDHGSFGCVFCVVGFVIAAEINPDEPSAIASCDDLANFASHRDFLLGSQGGTHMARREYRRAWIYQLIGRETTDRPAVVQMLWPIPKVLAAEMSAD
jgi:hypothetical protein